MKIFNTLLLLSCISLSNATECKNGLEGHDGKYFLNENVEVCCSIGCDGCGGTGCHIVGEPSGKDNTDCCTSHIVWRNITCEDSGEAPCLLEPLSSEFGRDEEGQIVFTSSVKTSSGSSYTKPTSLGFGILGLSMTFLFLL